MGGREGWKEQLKHFLLTVQISQDDELVCQVEIILTLFLDHLKGETVSN